MLQRAAGTSRSVCQMLRGVQVIKIAHKPVSSCWSRQSRYSYSTATSNVVELSSDSHITKAIASDKLSVLDFTAKWCGPCKMIAPEYEKMSVEFPQPTFKLLRKGSVVAEMTGADKNMLRKYLRMHAK